MYHRRRRVGPGLALLSGLALVLAGCDDDAPDGTPSEAAVTVAGFEFEPSSLTVPAGSTVTWDNEDTVAHTATAGSPGDPEGTFDERLDGSGGTATVTFDEPGTFAYFCSFHPQMVAEIVVE